MNFSVVVRVLREEVGIFCPLSMCDRKKLTLDTYMVDCRECAVGSPNFSAGIPKPFKCLLRGMSALSGLRRVLHIPYR
jgi:hypothetical protein